MMIVQFDNCGYKIDRMLSEKKICYFFMISVPDKESNL
jgi:hypothetical protein